MITDVLREAILSGEFPEGMFLRQQSVAQRYDVSEIVVREALRRLESEGLVETKRRKGARVSQVSTAEMAEIYELRVILEQLIARYAVPRCTEADWQRAHALMEAMAHETDPVRWLALNRDFHHALYQPSGRTHLLKFADDLRLRMERYLRMSLGVLQGYGQGQAEHDAILQAFRQRNSELAAERIGAHLRRTAHMVGRFLDAKHVATGSNHAHAGKDLQP
jgi:DNA-binding GntR family transcriptional regulator